MWKLISIQILLKKKEYTTRKKDDWEKKFSSKISSKDEDKKNRKNKEIRQYWAIRILTDWDYSFYTKI